MASPTAPSFSVPKELPSVLKAFTREVLRANPPDIYGFGAEYFREVVAASKSARANSDTISAQLDRPHEVGVTGNKTAPPPESLPGTDVASLDVPVSAPPPPEAEHLPDVGEAEGGGGNSEAEGGGSGGGEAEGGGGDGESDRGGGEEAEGGGGEDEVGGGDEGSGEPAEGGGEGDDADSGDDGEEEGGGEGEAEGGGGEGD